jgi:hypothetical protein
MVRSAIAFDSDYKSVRMIGVTNAQIDLIARNAYLRFNRIAAATKPFGYRDFKITISALAC